MDKRRLKMLMKSIGLSNVQAIHHTSGSKVESICVFGAGASGLDS